MRKQTELEKKMQSWETENSDFGLPHYKKNGWEVWSDGFNWCISSEKHGKYSTTYKSIEKAIDFAEKRMKEGNNMKKTFTNKKIEEGIYKPENMNFAIVKPDGELYIHQHGQMMLQSVYENKEKFCDVTGYIEDWLFGGDTKRNTVRNIRQAAEIFYS